MDRPFALARWQPTAVDLPDGRWVAANITRLAVELAAVTEKIIANPYEPQLWIDRAVILRDMRYPELAAGDAHKAQRLVQSVQARIMDEPTWRLGYGMGFWMLGEDDDDEKGSDSREKVKHLAEDLEENTLDTRLVDLYTQAHKLLIKCMDFYQDTGEGMYFPRPYPWMEDRHLFRSDSLIRSINEEFLVASSKVAQGRIGSYCRLERHAFGTFNLPDKSSSEILGVFATRDIEAGITMIYDESRIWGCSGPGQGGSTRNLHGGVGCNDVIHPNFDNEDSARQDLRWIRDRTGKDAAEVITRSRMLTTAIDDGYAHPLDHPLIARLTPTYRRMKRVIFDYDQDIIILNDCLQQWGIDIFANPNFDTWVLFTINARVRNNCWDGMIHSGVSPLFSMFNHSCEANVTWSSKSWDYTTLRLSTARDIDAGEQLFVNYDPFVQYKPLEERRKRFRSWFDGDCQCTRCVREEEHLRRTDTGVDLVMDANVSEWEAVGGWDTAPKPSFPEDGLNDKLRRLRELAKI